jgi:hypothetical protein
MAKLTNVRERVHQPFRDALIRSSGWYQNQLSDRTDLFMTAGKSSGETNLKQGSVLPSDQSMVVLALRCFAWYRNSIRRAYDGGGVTITENGDYDIVGAANIAQAGMILNSNAVGNIEDVHRLYWQTEEQLLWSFGAGDKFSIQSMPTYYFPAGGGLHGEITGTDLLLWNNGLPTHQAILRLARAILIPPRQNIKCSAEVVALPVAGNAGTFGTSQMSRNLLSLTDNLNVADGINKVVSFVFDGLFSRDVQ